MSRWNNHPVEETLRHFLVLLPPPPPPPPPPRLLEFELYSGSVDNVKRMPWSRTCFENVTAVAVDLVENLPAFYGARNGSSGDSPELVKSV
jgi:hypothetical protein